MTVTAGPPPEDVPALRERLREAEETLAAIRSGSVDSLVVGPPGHERVFSLTSADRPYRLIVESLNEGAAAVSDAGVILHANPRLTALAGRPPGGLTGTAAVDLVVAGDRHRLVQLLRAAPGEQPRAEVELRTSDGGTVPVLVAGSAFDLDGVRLRSLALTDLTQLREAERALAESESRYRLLTQNAADLLVQLDARGCMVWVSPSADRLLGWDPATLVGATWVDLVHPDDHEVAAAALASLRDRARSATTVQLRIRHRHGQYSWWSATGRRTDDDPATSDVVIAFRDVDAAVHAQRALEHAVDFDELTGLAKRPVALARIHGILGSRPAHGWALLCVGVNAMRAVNEAYTYAAGDEVLRTVALRLVDAAGGEDRVARIAGDEFAVLLRGVTSNTDAATTADRLLAAVRGPVTVGDTHIHVTGCVGIALSNEHDAEALLRDATAAMRQAAAHGPDRWEFLDGNVGEQTRHTLAVLDGLRRALDEGRIQPWFMPIRSFGDGTVRGHEALARWIREGGDVAEPGEFLPVAERSGLVQEIDRAVLRQALDALPALPAEGSVAVNVSAATLASGTLDAYVSDLLRRTGVDPHRLHLEVTETALFEVTDTVTRTMRTLADAGVRWWVDDFGTGYSSISHLRDLPITGLKLDRSFTAALTDAETQATRLARGLAGLADGLGLQTVAEGVETAEQARVLAAQGWQLGQGWLYGRPVPLAAGTSTTGDSR